MYAFMYVYIYTVYICDRLGEKGSLHGFQTGRILNSYIFLKRTPRGIQRLVVYVRVMNDHGDMTFCLSATRIGHVLEMGSFVLTSGNQ